jgi:diaminopimelate epimerase
MQFHKYHALGNDYLVVDARSLTRELSVSDIQRICDRHLGVGSDGILLGPLPATADAPFALRIFNPDGSEAQKSGNGLRIFCRYLFDCKLVANTSFRIHTKGGVVEATVHGRGESVTVEMGRVTFDSAAIPLAGPRREVIRERKQFGEEMLTITCASIGNPHCVVELEADEDMARRIGPLIENDAMFPERTNVQFLKVIDRNHIAIRIWERGAGYTLASGSSSSAAAAAAHRLGLVDSHVAVHMPGGTIQIDIAADYAITMTGGVTRVANGNWFDEIFTYGSSS